MGLPKKGSRIICLNNQEYRWLVTSGKDQILTLAIEKKDDPGQRLLTYFDKNAVYQKNKMGQWINIGQLRRIGPRVVANIIDVSIKRGWNPDTKSKPPFLLKHAPTLFPFQKTNTLPKDAIVPSQLLNNYLVDLLEHVSLCPKWRKIILESDILNKINAPIPPSAPATLREHDKINKLNLKFVVFNDGISPDGVWFVIGAQCKEFPSEAVYSTNRSDVWIGE